MRITARKSAIALALVAPLALAACGNDEQEDAAAKSTVTSTAEKSSKDADKDKDKSSEKKDPKSEKEAKDKQEPKPNTPPEKQYPDAPGLPESNGGPSLQGGDELDRVQVAPVEGGQAADPQVQGEITQLVSGFYETDNLRDMFRYVPDRTCQQVLNESPELKAPEYDSVPEIKLKDLPNSQWNQSGVESVQDVKVKGDIASAVVTVNTPEGQDKSTMRFKNEGGWKFCN